jgi:hypothetical protein
MFNHQMKGDTILRNPVSRVRFLNKDNQQDRALTYTEQRKYLAVATEAIQEVAGISLDTWMRPEEVYALAAVNVELERGFQKVLKAKTPAARCRIELQSAAAY